VNRIAKSQGIAVFSAVFIGNVAAYVMTAYQLALAHPSDGIVMTSFIEFFNIFAVTQVSLGVIEGLLSVVAINLVKSLNFGEPARLGTNRVMME